MSCKWPNQKLLFVSPEFREIMSNLFLGHTAELTTRGTTVLIQGCRHRKPMGQLGMGTNNFLIEIKKKSMYFQLLETFFTKRQSPTLCSPARLLGYLNKLKNLPVIWNMWALTKSQDFPFGYSSHAWNSRSHLSYISQFLSISYTVEGNLFLPISVEIGCQILSTANYTTDFLIMKVVNFGNNAGEICSLKLGKNPHFPIYDNSQIIVLLLSSWIRSKSGKKNRMLSWPWHLIYCKQDIPTEGSFCVLIGHFLTDQIPAETPVFVHVIHIYQVKFIKNKA